MPAPTPATPATAFVSLPADLALRLALWGQQILGEELVADTLLAVACQVPDVVQAWLDEEGDPDLLDLLYLGAERAGIDVSDLTKGRRRDGPDRGTSSTASPPW